jgi:hypothetical protein
MGPGPATQAAFVRGFLLCLITARWRTTAQPVSTLDVFALQCAKARRLAPRIKTAAFAKASCGGVTLGVALQQPCGEPAALFHFRLAARDSLSMLHASKSKRAKDQESEKQTNQERSWGRRPQCPGNQSRLRTFLDVPPAIRFRQSPAAAGPTAIIRQAQEITFRCTHSQLESCFVATQKSRVVVKKLWTM